MDRAISGFHLDSADDWVAELTCGHNQHVRHKPPFLVRAWVLDADERTARLGTPLACVLCERCELPEALRLVRTTAPWDESTMPAGLRRSHRLAAGTWGRLSVHQGRLHFRAATTPALDVELEAGATQAIPPELDHDVEPRGPVTFSIEFFAVDRNVVRVTHVVERESVDEGGDRACWAGLLCPDCGAMVEGGHHHPDCSFTMTSS